MTIITYKGMTRLQRQVRDLILLGASIPMIADILSIRESVQCPHCEQHFDLSKDFSEQAVKDVAGRVRGKMVIREDD